MLKQKNSTHISIIFINFILLLCSCFDRKIPHWPPPSYQHPLDLSCLLPRLLCDACISGRGMNRKQWRAARHTEWLRCQTALILISVIGVIITNRGAIKCSRICDTLLLLLHWWTRPGWTHKIAWLILTLMTEINQNYNVRVHYQAVHRSHDRH